MEEMILTGRRGRSFSPHAAAAAAVAQLSAGGSDAAAEMEADFSVLAAPSAFVGERLSIFGCA